ncbi:MAG: zinc-dependent alcohol dehydrogenase family protein [Firmicutes bacterium]|uniref:Alcohol dehydrogenase n=1 Tax=Melghirimyces thermohalophilus TaxID=1236220 RepID=A0A1G6NVQ1_9BACL|nr:zinc-dependent alcohol dehydrogenase family protein [Melghirimyces thermohalophilus]MDA8353818.1 zinc-dependent alcohol dehydrogenase family protein [Bacillota bacterium]SDC71808.1 alcohol dehydrogenase [Melghirimyces thermohalophilus]
MKTRAAVLYEMALPAPYSESRPLRVEELELAPPGPGEVLVRIRAAGLCHSDLSVINGSRPRPTPMAIGHEAAGEVVETGNGVSGLEPGDHVVCAFVPSCGDCAPCREGRPALCEPGAEANNQGVLLSGARRLKKDGTVINHHLGVSGFADYAVIDQHSLIPVDREIPFPQVALFGCAVMTGVGAVINTARVPAGSSVAIVGLGGVGLSALLGAVVAGARQIVAVDVNPSKLELAKSLGATDGVNAAEADAVQQIRSVTEGGVEYAFETAGVVPAMQTAYRITRRGGMTVTSGLPHPKDEFSIPQVTLAAEERTIKGSYIGSCIPKRDLPRMIQLYKQGRLPVDRLLTDTLPLEAINEGFDRLARGEAARLVVTM